MNQNISHTQFSTDDVNFAQVQQSQSFKALKKRHRSFVFPMALAFLIWYVLYVILAMYFPQFMANKVAGNINMGIVLGLLQFVTTFGITGWYVAFANRKLDPYAESLRQAMEAGEYTQEQEG